MSKLVNLATELVEAILDDGSKSHINSSDRSDQKDIAPDGKEYRTSSDGTKYYLDDEGYKVTKK